MNSHVQSRRIVWLVRLLTATGLIVVITTLTVVGSVLRHVRAERSELMAEQRRLNQSSDQLRHFASLSHAEMQATLDSGEAAPDVGTAAINLRRLVQSELASKPDAAVLQPLVELDHDLVPFVALQAQADAWRAQDESISNKIVNQTAIKKLRQDIKQMQLAVPRQNDPAGALHEQIDELARLVEVLAGEERIDALTELKDKQIDPLLASLTQSIAGLKDSPVGAGILTPTAVDDVRLELFGQPDDENSAGDDSQTIPGGLYTLRHDVLQLRRDREKLKTQSSSIFEDVEEANANYARSAQSRILDLAHQMESTLIAGWTKMLIIGAGCSGVFLWLAFMISRGIAGQVKTIEDARAEAETGRQTTHKLMLQQQAAAEELKVVHKKLLEASRKAGMAEIATGVLHNVGNVLNSVNVSASVISEKLKKSRLGHLKKLVDLMRDHQSDLGTFITSDPAGKQIPTFIAQLTDYFQTERDGCVNEMGVLHKNIEHIKEIISTQQAYAGTRGLIESVDIREMLDDALRIHRAELMRFDIDVVRELSEAPPVRADKHKVLQILINLISNAKHAMKESAGTKTLTLRIDTGQDCVRVSVRDTGYGIALENMTRIFAHGFTTKKDGHGFGLHSGANAAKELGGSLQAHSDGPGRGAVFTLELPMDRPAAMAA